MKLDILAIGAHPDDVELGCGATLAKEASLGRQIGILDLTRGELGTRGTAQIRAAEAKAASAILGVSIRENMDFDDGFFVNDRQHQMALIEKIRYYRPEVVLLNATDDRHIDHPRAAQLALATCFLSGLQKIVTHYDGTQQQAWRPKRVYHYIQWKHQTPDFVVDISAFMDIKLNAVRAYRSQFYDPKSTEPETPISHKDFIDSVKYRAQDLGRLTGVAYGEGFIAERYPLVNSLNDLM